jgi:membrane-associated HD superfamily phosphohydrolase
MLADGVEAAVRSLREKTPERIVKMVENVIADRIKDGQLERSELSFHELDKIEEVFGRVLMSAYHLRPEYPELKLKEKRNLAHLPQQPSPKDPPSQSPAG